MQADTLSLAVDVANDATIVTVPYSRYEETQNRTVYVGADHEPGSRDQIALYRTLPTRSGNFRGVGKSAIKLTKDTQVLGHDSSTSIMSSLIIDVTFSVPVGCDSGKLLKARQTLISLLDDDTFMNKLNVQLMV